MPKTLKRIHSVTIKRTIDDLPDTSYLGEYSSHADSDYSIDREHDMDCAVQSYNQVSKEGFEKLEHAIDYLNTLRYPGELTPEDDRAIEDAEDLLIEKQTEVKECNCSGGSRERNEYRYFNPNVANYEGETHENKVKYCIQDYNRMESLNNGSWCFIGIVAEARYSIPITTHLNMTPFERTDSITQTITSGGLWGIESDSDASYFTEVEQEQLSELLEQLHAIGFSYRAIAATFKDIERKED